MNSGLLIRLRPTSPWRFGSDSGDRSRIAPIYHSDTLYSAVTGAMAGLGMLEEWLQATALAQAEPDVLFSSLFPWQNEILYIVPPRNIWPPAAMKLRAKGARFVPVSLVEPLLSGNPLEEDQWFVDGLSKCLLHRDGEANRAGPFRTALRSNAAVDRLSVGSVQPHKTACLEFAGDAGLWTFVGFSGEEAKAKWKDPVEGAFRLLADSGFGGRRSIGWGRSAMPEITSASLPELLALPLDPPAEPDALDEEPKSSSETVNWLLSVFIPAGDDTMDWQRGSYSLLTRGGRVESSHGWGQPKKLLRMVGEGSVLYSGSPPKGVACNVAPDGCPHPVFRYGFALSIPIPGLVAP